MDDIRKKLLAYFRKHADVEELLKQSSVVNPSPSIDVQMTPTEMQQDKLGRKVKTETVPQRHQIRRRRQAVEATSEAPSQDTAPSAPSRPSDSPWRKLPEGQERKYTTVETPGPYGPTSPGSKKTKVEVVNTPGYLQSKYGSGNSMHPGGGAYTSKQLRTLVKDFLREYDI